MKAVVYDPRAADIVDHDTQDGVNTEIYCKVLTNHSTTNGDDQWR